MARKFLTPIDLSGLDAADLAPLRLGQIGTPTSFQDGDVWITSLGMYARVAGSTVGPFAAGGVSVAGSPAASDIPIFTGAATISNAANAVAGSTFQAAATGGGLAWTLNGATYTSDTSVIGFNVSTRGNATLTGANSIVAARGYLDADGYGSTTNSNYFIGVRGAVDIQPAAGSSLATYIGVDAYVNRIATTDAYTGSSNLIGVRSYVVGGTSATTGLVLNSLVGVQVDAEIVNSAASGTATYGTLTGLRVMPVVNVINGGVNATINNAYGLYLNDFTQTGAGTSTLTNRYGVYQVGASNINRWEGGMLFVPRATAPTATAGMLYVDSSLSNALLWHNGSGWQTVGAGSIGGSIAVNQIAYGSGTNAIQGTANFNFTNSKLTTAVNTTTYANLNIGAHSANPTSLVNGDIWCTAANLFLRRNGGTGILVEHAITTTTGVIPAWSAFNGILGDADGFTWTSITGGKYLSFDAGTPTSGADRYAFLNLLTVNTSMSGTSASFVGRMTTGGGSAGATSITAGVWADRIANVNSVVDGVGARHVGVYASVSSTPPTYGWATNSTFVGTLSKVAFTSATNDTNRPFYQMSGVDVELSAQFTGTSGTATPGIDGVFGLRVTPGTFSVGGTRSVTISNFYGLYLGTLTTSGILNVTARYGVYQADPSATNVLKGTLRFDGSTSGSTTIQVAAVAGGTFTLQLPTTAGSNGYLLSTNGSGTLSWVAPAGGTIGGTIAANQIAVGSGTDTISGSSSLTATTNSGSYEIVHTAGTSTATGQTFAHRLTATYSGANNNVTGGLYASVTITSTPASAVYSTGVWSLLTANPGGSVPSGYVYSGLRGVAQTSTQASTRMAGASLVGVFGAASFLVSDASGTPSLAALTGLHSDISLFSVTTGSTTITAVYGVRVAPTTFSTSVGGTTTVSDYYGIYLGTLTTSGSGTTTITNRWGVYQADTAASNYFAGTTTFNTAVTCNSTLQAAGLKSTASVEAASAGYLYLGDPATDGTWRVGRSGNDLVMERRESGTYVTKQTILA